MDSVTKPVTDCYKSIAAPSRGLYKDKGSKFLSFAYPVSSEAQIKDIVASLKKEYFDARHHCYAYRLGLSGDRWRANDDGEPSSTAGRPILGQILSAELSDILIVVVRYFGGILLGTSGLTVAYKTAAADAIANSAIIEKTASELFEIRFDYLQMNDVMKAIKELQIVPMDQIFDEKCLIVAPVRLRDIPRFKEMLKSTDICQRV
ncbi:MAG: YigZ family protein [Bacteroidales bacterium]|nr:YigZ family protein [Bacteroidales bacterium]